MIAISFLSHQKEEEQCPACGERIRDPEHAVVLHREPYHVDCALYNAREPRRGQLQRLISPAG